MQRVILLICVVAISIAVVSCRPGRAPKTIKPIEQESEYKSKEIKSFGTDIDESLAGEQCYAYFFNSEHIGTSCTTTDISEYDGQAVYVIKTITNGLTPKSMYHLTMHDVVSANFTLIKEKSSTVFSGKGGNTRTEIASCISESKTKVKCDFLDGSGNISTQIFKTDKSPINSIKGIQLFARTLDWNNTAYAFSWYINLAKRELTEVKLEYKGKEQITIDGYNIDVRRIEYTITPGNVRHINFIDEDNTMILSHLFIENKEYVIKPITKEEAQNEYASPRTKIFD